MKTGADEVANTFFSDIDNTLIYSYRKKISAEKIIAEYLNGREQSYMTKSSYNFLKDNDWLNVVPVTTRTDIQYKRIFILSDFNIQYSIVCNGGKLLVNGVEDNEWTDETREISMNHIDDMNEAINVIRKLVDSERIHQPESYLCYTKVERPDVLLQELCSKINLNNIELKSDGRKLYMYVRSINKGSAIRRFRKRFDTGTVIASGDSLMDVEMLNEADYAFSPEMIFDKVKAVNKIKIRGTVITDSVFAMLRGMHSDGII